MARHIAIKCTYNNGGEGHLVGFCGTCSEDIIKWNIEQGRVWCSQPQCECQKFYKAGFKGKKPVHPCMESTLFRDVAFGAGHCHSDKKKGQPKHWRDVAVGKLAVLTTRFPCDKEEQRKIIGLFRITKVDARGNGQTMLHGDKQSVVRLPLEEAKELYFWDYYETEGGASWGSGLGRYLADSAVAAILSDVRETTRNSDIKRTLSELLSDGDLQNGLRKRAGKKTARTERILRARKYGGGGEGSDHRRLKKWLARNPEALGLRNVVSHECEYRFPSGDLADILFELGNGRYAVVEVETVDPVPGFYQALKYGVLKCAEENLSINSPKVSAFLVAWQIPEALRRKCRHYGVHCLEKKV